MSTLPPVRASVVVRQAQADAFATFTEEIGTWWPAGTHSVGGDKVVAVVLEPALGGGLYEEWDDGTRVPWGQVTTWEAPDRIVFSWHPGMDREESTEVEVTFTPSGTSTLVELVHRNWERRGAEAAAKRAQYETGWPVTLERFRDEAERSNAGSAP